MMDNKKINNEIFLNNFVKLTWLRLFVHKEFLVGEFSKETALLFISEISKMEESIFEENSKNDVLDVGQMLEDLKEMSNSETANYPIGILINGSLIDYLSKLDEETIEKIKEEKVKRLETIRKIDTIIPKNISTEDWG